MRLLYVTLTAQPMPVSQVAEQTGLAFLGHPVVKFHLSKRAVARNGGQDSRFGQATRAQTRKAILRNCYCVNFLVLTTRKL